MAANRQRVKIDDKFTVGGEKLFLPSDPAASFEETANCRCDVEFIGPESRIGGVRFGRRQACEIYNKAHQNYIHIREDILKRQDELEFDIVRILNTIPYEKRKIVNEHMPSLAVDSASSIIGADNLKKLARNFRWTLLVDLVNIYRDLDIIDTNAERKIDKNQI